MTQNVMPSKSELIFKLSADESTCSTEIYSALRTTTKLHFKITYNLIVEGLQSLLVGF